MAYLQKSMRNVAIIFVLTGLAGLVGYILRVILARNLGVEEYGLFFAVFVFVNFFNVIRDLGFNSALIKFISEYNAKKQPSKMKSVLMMILSFKLAITSVLIVVLFFLSGYLAQHYFRNSLAGPILKLLLIMLFFENFYIVAMNTFKGMQNMFMAFMMDLVKITYLTITVLLLFYFDLGIFSPAIAYMTVFIVMSAVFCTMLARYPFFKEKTEFSSSIFKKILMFSIPATFTVAATKIVSDLDTLMLTYMDTLAAVGIYQVVLPTALLFIMFSDAISEVLFPLSSELYAKNEKEKLASGIREIHKYLFLITLPVFFALVLYSKELIGAVFGAEYALGYVAFQFLLTGILFMTLAKINTIVLTGIGMPQKVTLMVIYSAVLNFALNLVLIPLFSINGAAIATAASYMLVFGFSFYEIRKAVKFKIPVMDWGKTMFAGLCFLLIAILLKNAVDINIWLEVIFVSFAAFLVYVFIAVILRVITLKEIVKYVRAVF